MINSLIKLSKSRATWSAMKKLVIFLFLFPAFVIFMLLYSQPPKEITPYLAIPYFQEISSKIIYKERGENRLVDFFTDTPFGQSYFQDPIKYKDSTHVNAAPSNIFSKSCVIWINPNDFNEHRKSPFLLGFKAHGGKIQEWKTLAYLHEVGHCFYAYQQTDHFKQEEKIREHLGHYTIEQSIYQESYADLFSIISYAMLNSDKFNDTLFNLKFGRETETLAVYVSENQLSDHSTNLALKKINLDIIQSQQTKIQNPENLHAFIQETIQDSLSIQ